MIRGGPARPRARRSRIEAHLKNRLRLTKIHRLLARSGIVVPYSTLHRFAVQELGFGRKAATVPVADREPGHELQVDTGWVLNLEPDGAGVRRRKKAFVFTPNVSRYRFVYPIEHETTAEAIAACEAAWAFYSGIFRVMIGGVARRFRARRRHALRRLDAAIRALEFARVAMSEGLWRLVGRRFATVMAMYFLRPRSGDG